MGAVNRVILRQKAELATPVDLIKRKPVTVVVRVNRKTWSTPTQPLPPTRYSIPKYSAVPPGVFRSILACCINSANRDRGGGSSPIIV